MVLNEKKEAFFGSYFAFFNEKRLWLLNCAVSYQKKECSKKRSSYSVHTEIIEGYFIDSHIYPWILTVYG